MRHFITALILLLATSLSAQETIKKKNGKVTINKNGIVVEQGTVKKHLREGAWTRFYETGELKENVTYSQGVMAGPYRFYSKEGKLKTEGFYTNGLPTDQWKTYDSQGRQISGVNYDKSGKILSTERYESGRLKEQHVKGAGGYEYVKVYNTDGSLRKRYTTIDEKREGIYYEYKGSPTGGDTLPIKITHYRNGSREGSDMEWQIVEGKRVLRSETWYKNNEKDSIHRTYDARTHKLKVSYYKNDRIEGEEITYIDSAVTSRTWYTKGRSDSTYQYYPDGKTREIKTKEHFRKYYPDGKLEEERLYYKTGSSDGPLTTYYPNGKKKYELNYIGARINGEWKAWNENGVLVIHAWAYRSADTLEYVYNNKGKKLAETDTAYEGQIKRYLPSTLTSKAQNDRFKKNTKKKTTSYEEEIWETTDGVDEAVPMIVEEMPVERESEAIFTFAEEMPVYPGGEAAFQEYLKKNLVYPKVEQDAGKQGTVYLYFVVQKDGAITDVKALKEVAGAPGFTKEAIRVIKSMPPWTPGKMNGRPVAVSMTIPVRFSMN